MSRQEGNEGITIARVRFTWFFGVILWRSHPSACILVVYYAELHALFFSREYIGGKMPDD